MEVHFHHIRKKNALVSHNDQMKSQNDLKYVFKRHNYGILSQNYGLVKNMTKSHNYEINISNFIILTF